jgi:hypothetical protein
MQSISTTSAELDKDTNKQICEALGCSQYATKEITVDAGRLGSISLLLCRNCVGKFVSFKEDGDPKNAYR